MNLRGGCPLAAVGGRHLILLAADHAHPTAVTVYMTGEVLLVCTSDADTVHRATATRFSALQFSHTQTPKASTWPVTS